MPIQDLTFISSEQVAEHTYIINFKKPAGFKFIPGQYGGFTQINPPEQDDKGINRRFSILSSPNDKNIQIITRLQGSAYKRNLINMKSGETIKFAGPTGKFVLPENDNQPIILLAGGMGIAPFYSMVKFATQNQLNHKFTIIYGNPTLESTALKAELDDLAQQNHNIKIIYTLNEPPKDWNGESGFIRDDMITSHCPDYSEAKFMVCGSPAMVTAMQNLLKEIEIDETNVAVEDFPGY